MQHVKNLIKGRVEEIKEKGELEVSIGGTLFLIKRQFVEDLEPQNLLSVVGEMHKAFLFLHAPDDQIVSVDNAARLYTAAHHPKSFISLAGADHLLNGVAIASRACVVAPASVTVSVSSTSLVCDFAAF